MIELKKQIAAGLFAAATLVAPMATAETLVTFGDPWNQRDTLTTAMDLAFGDGEWTDVDMPADTSFLSGESFVYLEGGDNTTDEMEGFLGANATALLNWISAGGSLFINAAPNEGDGLSFGGLDLANGMFCSTGCDAVDPMHPIFGNGAGTSFGGGFFSHAEIAGGSSLITDTGTGGSILSELAIGDGFLMMGGMTTTNFHTGDDPLQLRVNILTYGAEGGSVAAVPLPAAGWLLFAGVGGIAAFGRRKKKA